MTTSVIEAYEVFRASQHDLHEQVRKAYRERVTVAELARQAGVSRFTIYAWLKEAEETDAQD